MEHPHAALMRRLYDAYMTGDMATITALISPDVVWETSGYDWTAGTLHGLTEVLAFMGADDHMRDGSMEVVDILASDSRAAVIARTRGRRGDAHIVIDSVQVVEIDNGVITAVRNFAWDQRAIAEFMAVPL